MSNNEKQSPKSIITVQTRKLASEFESFYNKIKALEQTKDNFKIFKKSYLSYQDRLDLSSKLFEMTSKGLIESRQEVPNVTRITFLHPFYYLGYVESIGNALTNMVVMILVACGIDFHVVKGKWRVKHITSIKELEKERVSLTRKLDFLKENGIKEFSNAIDSRLRNSIAHMDFQIRDVEIYVRGKPIASEVAKAYANLSWALSGMMLFIEQLAKETGLASKNKGVSF